MSLRVVSTSLSEVKLLYPARFTDERGYFSETYRDSWMEHLAPGATFVQDNQSLSRAQGTIRGLHFQVAPAAQGKLVRVVRGSILDVAVDLRQGSPTFGRHVAAVVSSQEGNQIWIPVGFAHGFCTLEADTEVAYKVTAPYAPDCDRGLLWNDPALGIEWPVAPADAIVGAKDRMQPRLEAIGNPFVYSPDPS
jgi:dTDP-4-dehydrorhamnose 3,5-epimerase